MSVGKTGELLALKFLEKKGLVILDTNYHSRFGEIDIIAQESETTIFIEVKTRTNTLFGQPLDAITYSKLQKMIKTAQFYLVENKLAEKPYRFDAVEVFIGGKNSIEHIENITI